MEQEESLMYIPEFVCGILATIEVDPQVIPCFLMYSSVMN